MKQHVKPWENILIEKPHSYHTVCSCPYPLTQIYCVFTQMSASVLDSKGLDQRFLTLKLLLLQRALQQSLYHL